jgi:hypothetical protein
MSSRPAFDRQKPNLDMRAEELWHAVVASYQGDQVNMAVSDWDWAREARPTTFMRTTSCKRDVVARESW